jgi:hypothetical protein
MKLARSIVRHNPAKYSIKIIEFKLSVLIADLHYADLFAVFTWFCSSGREQLKWKVA